MGMYGLTKTAAGTKPFEILGLKKKITVSFLTNLLNYISCISLLGTWTACTEMFIKG